MKTLTMLLSVTLVCGCASNNYTTPPADFVPVDQIIIKPRFEQISLTKENLAAELKKCVPTLQDNSEGLLSAARNFPNDKYMSKVGHISSSREFILAGSIGICLEFSTNRFPIYAAEALLETVNPVGVPPKVTHDWYKQIALKIATQGEAKVAYVTTKGDAFLASYWSDPVKSIALNYWQEFKKAGEWENTEVDYKFSHPAMHSVTNIKRGSSERGSSERGASLRMVKNVLWDAKK